MAAPQVKCEVLLGALLCITSLFKIKQPRFYRPIDKHFTQCIFDCWGGGDVSGCARRKLAVGCVVVLCSLLQADNGAWLTRMMQVVAQVLNQPACPCTVLLLRFKDPDPLNAATCLAPLITKRQPVCWQCNITQRIALLMHILSDFKRSRAIRWRYSWKYMKASKIRKREI